MTVETKLASFRALTKNESLLDLELKNGMVKVHDFSSSRREYGNWHELKAQGLQYYNLTSCIWTWYQITDVLAGESLCLLNFILA